MDNNINNVETLSSLMQFEFISDVNLHKQYEIKTEDYGVPEEDYQRLLTKYPTITNRYADRVMLGELAIENVPGNEKLPFNGATRVVIKIREIRIEEAELLKELKRAYNIKE